MKLNDIYKHKEFPHYVQIDSFASHISYGKDMLIIVRDLHSDGSSCPSFNKYGTAEEIENYYEKVMDSDELKSFDSWEDIFKKLNLYLGSNHLIIEEMRNVITNADKILSQLLKENIEQSDFVKKQMLIDNSREQLCKKLYEKWLRTNKGNNQYEFIKSFDNETYKNTRRSSWLLNKFLSYVENVQYLEKKNIK